MDKLRRVTHRIRGNRRHAVFVEFARRTSRQHDPVAQCREKGEPEGIVFVHVQRAGYTDEASGRLCLRQRLILKKAPVFVIVKVGDSGPDFFFTFAPLAAVAGIIGLAAGKTCDGYQAVVAAIGAAAIGRFGTEAVQIGGADKRGRAAWHVTLFGDQRRSVGAHYPGDIRPDHLAADRLFKGAENGVIVKRSALYDDFLAQVGGVFDPDHFIQGVADDGNGYAGRNIADICAVLIRLLHLGVHKYRAASAEVDRMPGFETKRREFPDIHAERLGEIFNERTASGGTSFVQHDRLDYAVADEETLHVLATDVENEVHAWQEMVGSLIVGHSFDLTNIGPQRDLGKPFAVAGDDGVDDTRPVVHLRVQVFQRQYRCIDRPGHVGSVI